MPQLLRALQRYPLQRRRACRHRRNVFSSHKYPNIFCPYPQQKKKRQPLRITSSNHGVFRRNREGRFSSLTRKIFSYPNNELAIHFFYEIDCLHIHCNKLFFHANRNCCTHFFQTKIATQLIVGTNGIVRNNQQGIREHGNIKNLA